jgi:hypothetical protein
MARLFRNHSPGPLAATPVTVPGPRPRLSPRPGVRRAALAVAVLLAVAVAHLAGNDAESARLAAADPELARLIRAMAFIKAAMAAAAVWLADRLLRRPLGAGLALGILLAAAFMAAAPVLMWHVAHVGTGALLFHAAAILLLVLGWRPAEAWVSARSRERAR